MRFHGVLRTMEFSGGRVTGQVLDGRDSGWQGRRPGNGTGRKFAAEERTGVGLGPAKDGFVHFAVGVFGQHSAEGGVSAHGTTAMTDGKETALQAILVFDEVFGAFHKLPARRTG